MSISIPDDPNTWPLSSEDAGRLCDGLAKWAVEGGDSLRRKLLEVEDGNEVALTLIEARALEEGAFRGLTGQDQSEAMEKLFAAVWQSRRDENGQLLSSDE